MPASSRGFLASSRRTDPTGTAAPPSSARTGRLGRRAPGRRIPSRRCQGGLGIHRDDHWDGRDAHAWAATLAGIVSLREVLGPPGSAGCAALAVPATRALASLAPAVQDFSSCVGNILSRPGRPVALSPECGAVAMSRPVLAKPPGARSATRGDGLRFTDRTDSPYQLTQLVHLS